MKRMLRFTTLVLLFSIFAKIGMSQENYASNVTTSVSDDEKLLITYDIVSTDGAKSFNVILFITHQGSQVKASASYGNLGTVSPGREKTIVWYFKKDFNGNIADVKVEVFAYKENEPQAIFEITSLSNNGYAPSEVIFSNKSVYANEYQWNFGDPASGAGNLSFEKDTKYVYKKGGFYSISLTARNSKTNLENTFYQSIQIKTHEPVTAGFEIEGNNQLAPANVSFKNASVNADNYEWDFGDPSIGRKNKSNMQNGSIKYKNPGTYIVKLVSKNNFSGLTDTITKEVVVENEKIPEAGFIYSKSSEIAPSTVAFKNTSMFADRYEWNFGDPSSGDKNTSAEKNPAHLFSEPGSYKVQLSAWAKGVKKPSTFSEVVDIKELPQPPEARFSIQNNNVMGPATIIFINNSINASKFLWKFGDPDSGNDNTSENKSPTHTYKNPGRYQVELTVSSPGFSRESTVTEWVVINSPSLPKITPEARFSIEKDEIPAPAIVNFTDKSTNADTFLWDFGDEKSDENTSVLKNPVHVYSREGKYKVTLTVKNASSGQLATFTEFVTVISQPKPIAAPEAGFNFDFVGKNMVAPARVTFINTSQNADSFTWNFGDSYPGITNISSQKNPEHLFEKEGEYKVILTARNKDSGKESVVIKTLVVKKPLSPPVTDFEMIPDNEFVPVKVYFKNLSTNADTYNWNFGDFDSSGNESTAFSPTHNYNVPGKYKITLEVVNSESGEVQRSSKELTIRSNFSAFVKETFGNETESAVSLLNLPGNEYLTVIKKRNNKSVVLKLNNDGEIIDQKEFDYLLSGVVPVSRENKFMMTGISPFGKLFVMSIDSELKSSEPVLFQEVKKFNTDNFLPELALSITDEIGVIANTLDDRYPSDVLFQKTDKSGRIVPLADRTFKYVGSKLVTDFISTSDGGFALTGYYQVEKDSLLYILFAKIDRRGHGEMQLITSEMNILGFNIKESYQKGYAIIRAEELPGNERYDISFTLVDSKGGPTDCANLLPCSVKEDDLMKYKPAMIKINEGYAIASHCFNGFDYDITLYWIDKTGNELIRYEPLILPGDQFVMDMVQTNDGGYVIAGTQTKNGRNEALVIKTDPWGKLNP